MFVLCTPYTHAHWEGDSHTMTDNTTNVSPQMRLLHYRLANYSLSPQSYVLIMELGYFGHFKGCYLDTLMASLRATLASLWWCELGIVYHLLYSSVLLPSYIVDHTTMHHHTSVSCEVYHYFPPSGMWD